MTLLALGLPLVGQAEVPVVDGNTGDGIAPAPSYGTSGSQARVCESDWTAIFEEIARGIVEGVPVLCEFDVPEPPEGLTLDLDAIGVTYRSGDEVRAELDRVASEDACTDNGWYFDDPVAPTTMSLCPEACRTVQADPDARLDIALGCDPRLD